MSHTPGPLHAGRESHLWELTRDGQHVMTGAMQECWAYIHRTHSFSVDHACRHEGYKIEPAIRKAKGETK